MDTNQIAAAVQRGQADVLTLWEAVRQFAYQQSIRWYLALGYRTGMEIEDFEQSAFLALLDALNGWELGKWSFLTVYGTALKSAFTDATGQRTQRDKRDPLQNCTSLDMPIAESEGNALTLADVLPDPEAEQAIADIEKRDRRQCLHNALQRALQTLSEPQRRAVVLRYCYGLTLDETAARMGMTRATARATEQKGLRLLRQPKNIRELRAYL